MTATPAALLPTAGIDADRVVLFCLPHAGGGTSQFYRWQRLVPAWLQVAPLRLPGREDRLREAPYSDFGTLIDHVTQAVALAAPARYALLGHSMGSYVAFEVARRVSAQNQPGPLSLIVAGASSPQFVTRRNPLSELDDETFIAEIARRYDGLPEAILADRRLLALVLPALRADIALVESYEYRETRPLACDILALGGRDDPGVNTERLAGWGVHTSQSFTMHQFAGGHFFLHPEPRRVAGVNDPPPTVITVVSYLAELSGESL